MKVLELSQQISHCKSVQIFYDVQGKLTPQSEVGSTALPARMNKIQSKMKALEFSQHYQSIFKMLKGS